MKRLLTKRLWNGPLRGCSFGILVNKHSLWVGLHYSGYCRRFCLNIVPCVTVWLALEGGIEP